MKTLLKILKNISNNTRLHLPQKRSALLRCIPRYTLLLAHVHTWTAVMPLMRYSLSWDIASFGFVRLDNIRKVTCVLNVR